LYKLWQRKKLRSSLIFFTIVVDCFAAVATAPTPTAAEAACGDFLLLHRFL
jgi:hypothetical protein